MSRPAYRQLTRFVARCRREMKDSRRIRAAEEPRAYLLQRLYMVYKELFVKRHWEFAAQLTFNTMMAIIPVFAVIFAVGRGFGFEESIAGWCREVFASQPQVGEAIVQLARQYIDYTHTGIIIGIGLLLMMWSVVSLFENVEEVFNNIWHVRIERSMGRKVVDYTAIIFLVPIVIIFYSGVMLFFHSVAGWLPEFQILTPAMRMLFGLALPMVLLWAFFLALYMVIPNTRVLFGQVWFPALLASLAITGLQAVYVHIQVLLTGYSIIYGSLAALPLFMIWLQASWYICIGFAELGHANQLLKLGLHEDAAEPSVAARLMQCLVVLGVVCRRQQQGLSPATPGLIGRATGYSPGRVGACVGRLTAAGLVYGVAVGPRGGGRGPADAGLSGLDGAVLGYVPAGDTSGMTVGKALAALVGVLPAAGSDPAMPGSEVEARLLAALRTGREALEKIRVTELSATQSV